MMSTAIRTPRRSLRPSGRAAPKDTIRSMPWRPRHTIPETLTAIVDPDAEQAVGPRRRSGGRTYGAQGIVRCVDAQARRAWPYMPRCTSRAHHRGTGTAGAVWPVHRYSRELPAGDLYRQATATDPTRTEAVDPATMLPRLVCHRARLSDGPPDVHLRSCPARSSGAVSQRQRR
jgi:hypothetical protein